MGTEASEIRNSTQKTQSKKVISGTGKQSIVCSNTFISPCERIVQLPRRSQPT
ncbi:hypothetical protein LEMLEM_LOCUS11084, partial [Lemmus lemmus]